MIRVLFFGKFSEMVDSSAGLELAPEGVATVTDIVSRIASIDPALHDEITRPQVLVAVNQDVVSRDAAVNDGDEVAFLPPVTGG